MPNVFRKILGAPKRALDAAMRRKVISAVVVAVLGVIGYQVSPELQQALIDLIDALLVMFQSTPEQIPESLILLLS